MTLSEKRVWLSEFIKYLPDETINRLFDELAGTPEKRAETLRVVVDYIERVLNIQKGGDHG